MGLFKPKVIAKVTFRTDNDGNRVVTETRDGKERVVKSIASSRKK